MNGALHLMDANVAFDLEAGGKALRRRIGIAVGTTAFVLGEIGPLGDRFSKLGLRTVPLPDNGTAVLSRLRAAESKRLPIPDLSLIVAAEANASAPPIRQPR